MSRIARFLVPLVALLSLLAIAPTVAAAPMAATSSTTTCDVTAARQALRITPIAISGNTATSVIENTSPDCSFDIGLASYRMFDDVLTNQVIFDYQTATIAPGQTLTLTVDLPDCKSQIDFFVGDVILSFPPTYSEEHRLLDVAFNGTEFCNAGCTLTQGYWKNHPDAWPVDNLTLGNTNYTEAELIDILKSPVRGNGLISLEHQLIAAKLNVANGAVDSSIAATIQAADDLIVSSGGTLSTSQVSSLVDALDDFNNGVTGPGHCS